MKRKLLCYKRKCLDANRQKKGKGRENDDENIVLFEPEFLSCWNIKEMYLKISMTIHRERNDRIEVETGE